MFDTSLNDFFNNTSNWAERLYFWTGNIVSIVKGRKQDGRLDGQDKSEKHYCFHLYWHGLTALHHRLIKITYFYQINIKSIVNVMNEI